ncbi:NAD(P)/FAD-dependent oxidoreductase [Marinomonas ostreistagni]|uniref:FAD-binding oxidoreductase n=1 Tax=Marinomonas ostreistagni TaxID=359209 RepID=A0ABS0ZAD2_9GAMM|nr:FAD-binding oxidoreductase [Marinomonas ostreistagni]MBJ7550602.1 FAD-binding oxidoreductase [Marinomonas ostreistagni]
MLAKHLSTYTNMPFWLADTSYNRTFQITPRYQMPTKVDVCIVGGGFTGMSAAITLVRAGMKVAVLEAGRMGEGASSRNGGLLGPSFSKLGVDGLERQYGRENVHTSIRESLTAFNWLVDFIREENIDCDLNLCGRFRGASHPSHYAGLIEQAEELAKVVDFPAIEVPKSRQHEEVGSNAYHGGVVYPTDGALQPAKLFAGLAQIAASEGAFLCEHTKVRKVDKQVSGFNVIYDGGQLQADQVIIATNGYTDGQFSEFKRRLIPIRSAMIATEELPESVVQSVSPKLRAHGGTERLVAYYRPSPDGKRILFGGRAFGRGDQPQLYSKYLQDFMIRTFPQLSETKIDYAWSGLIAYTFDHVPHIGKLDDMNYAMGYCGSGVGRANYFGRKVAQQVLQLAEGKTSFDAFPFKGRPLYNGTPWFLPAIMKWHDFADRQGW